ncbi:MAG: UDP-3-O-acyl-N-acetylglucosamine deacetylase [Deltaproteobacteria bacterium]|nr:UDP-3-O-acyl-N-acetylglucosamine deacetylase [Deltaproteobacteria bacterium]
MYQQRTIKCEIGCRNVGLHSGRKVSMKIRPGGVDSGISFVRTDLNGNNIVKADFQNVRGTTLATTIGLNGISVSTVEHLLSAFSGMGVDNAIVEVDSPEVPIMDGSSLPFVNLLKDVGTQTQGKCRKLLVIEKPVSVSDRDGSAKIVPSAEFRITYDIDFEHPLIGKQSYDMTFSDEVYEREICAARTFGFLKDVEYLQAKGLALGGSLKNAVVLDERRIINKDGLRCHDEFVKHKILDAIGDLSLLGMPIIGHFIAYKSGHKLNNLLLKELMEHKECWKVVTYYNGKNDQDGNMSLNVPSFKILDSINNQKPVMY